MRTVILLPFAEPDGVAPSDTQGTLEDLAVVTGLSRPARVLDPSWTGGGYTYVAADLDGWTAADAAAGDSILQRDVTIQVLLAFDLTNATGPACVVCRGLDGSASEYYAWGLELADAGGGNVEVRWLWMSAAGTLAAVMPGVYQHPGDTAEILLTATRRRVSTTEVVCRYYANDRLLAEVSTADGDIGGGTTGHTSVGARKVAGTWVNGFSGVIDQLKVTDYEMSAEEVSAVWERMTVHQPNGVIALRALSPPGAPWSRNPGSDIAKFINVAGQALGLAAARAEELRQNGLPHRAYADTIGPWEQLAGLPSNDRTPLDTRRSRIVAQLSRDNGYAPPQIRQALSGPLDLAPDDVELIEFSPHVADSFATLETERWHLEPAGSWTASGGALVLHRAAGSDLRYSPPPGGTLSPCHARLAVDDTTDLLAQVKVSWTSLPAFSTVGLFMHNRRTNDSLWFGVRFEGGIYKIGWQQLKAGVLSAFTVVETPTTNVVHYLRVTKGAAAGDYTLRWSTIGFNSMSSALIVGAGMAAPENVGVAAMSTMALIGSDLDATFDDFFVRAPRSRRAFHWYALRAPGLPGAADLLGANTTMRTIKPAHTHAYAITSRSLLCDSDGSVCDGGPMGAI